MCYGKFSTSTSVFSVGAAGRVGVNAPVQSRVEQMNRLQHVEGNGRPGLPREQADR